MARTLYTKEMVTRLHAAYDPTASEEVRVATIDLLVKEFDSNKASVIGKLGTEQLYVPLVKVEQVKKVRPTTRKQLVEQLTTLLGATPKSFCSIENSNRGEIASLVESVRKLV